MKIIEGCGHEKLVECGILPESNLCAEWVTISSVTTPCGHSQLYIPCNLRNEGLYYGIQDLVILLIVSILRSNLLMYLYVLDPASLSSYCRHPCESTLTCGHLCRGTCGSCFRARIHAGCGGRCAGIFVCGHGLVHLKIFSISGKCPVGLKSFSAEIILFFLNC